jgi:hypothetical protein
VVFRAPATGNGGRRRCEIVNGELGDDRAKLKSKNEGEASHELENLVVGLNPKASGEIGRESEARVSRLRLRLRVRERRGWGRFK